MATCLDLDTEDLGQWESEQLRVLGMLARLIEGNPLPVLSLAVLREVRYHAHHGHADAVREQAMDLVRSIDRSFDFRLTRLLLPEMSRWDFFEEDAGPDRAAGREERRRGFATALATDFWDRFPDPHTAVAEINRRVREILRFERKSEAADLAWWLLEARPEMVLPFARQVLAVPDSPVALCLGVVLVHLHRREPAAFAGYARDALETGVLVFRHGVARHFGWNVPRETPLEESEVELISRLLADPDPNVRRDAVHGLRRVAAFLPRRALDLAGSVDVGEGEEIVIELCRLADPDWEGIPDAFTDGDILVFLERIEQVDDLDDHGITQFLRFAWGRLPHAVLDMFFRRIERLEHDGYRSAYRPVPFHALHDTLSVFAGTDVQREALHRIRENSLDTGGLVLHSLADLYRDVSRLFGPVVIEVLVEWLIGGNERQTRTAMALLEHAPSSFFFDELELVVRALDRAEALGEDYSRQMAAAFFRIAMSGMRSGTSGEPYPQDIALRDRCQAVLPTLAVGLPVHRLVLEILRRAEQNIREATQEEDDD